MHTRGAYSSSRRKSLGGREEGGRKRYSRVVEEWKEAQNTSEKRVARGTRRRGRAGVKEGGGKAGETRKQSQHVNRPLARQTTWGPSSLLADAAAAATASGSFTPAETAAAAAQLYTRGRPLAPMCSD